MHRKTNVFPATRETLTIAPHVVMAAAENAALPAGKVGGVGDVIRDLPPALVARGVDVTVLIPEYGLFHDLAEARRLRGITVPFAGQDTEVNVLSLPSPYAGVEYIAFEHARFAPQGPMIYNDDGHDRPFATDAGKFALFSACVARYVLSLDTAPDVVHLHDWHAALYLFLREFHPEFSPLSSIRSAFTIHNLALQGIRPLDGDESSLAAWFPDLPYDWDRVKDPRYSDCINPMAVGIRMADFVNTVSPSYAAEIVEANRPDQGFRGGEGLERDLRDAAAQGKLAGILNGTTYPERAYRRPSFSRLVARIQRDVERWLAAGRGRADLHELASERLGALSSRRPMHLLTSIGRLTDQKAALFFETTSNGTAALDDVLSELGSDGLLVLLGSGDPALETELGNLSRKHDNFVFLCGYFDGIADALYTAGDLFLMPSSFEPCGISQMLAMRAGQPCVVHAVGGLRDTVHDGIDGFSFAGTTPTDQADAFVATVSRALRCKREQRSDWRRICSVASAARFSWDVAAAHYIETVYGNR